MTLDWFAAQASGQSFDVYGPVRLHIAKAGGDLILAWQAGALESAPTVNGPWNLVPGVSGTTHRVTPGDSGNVFYRVKL